MAVTHKLIQTITVGSGGAASIDFTSIPATYTDLKLLFSIRTNRASTTVDGLGLKINNVATNQNMIILYGDGSSVGSATDTTINTAVVASTATASVFGNGEYYLPNYSGSTNKSVSGQSVNENNATLSYMYMVAGLWSQTTVINQLTLYSINSATIIEYSSASLYGIKNSQENIMATKLIVDCSTGITTEVELTAEEIAQREADAAAWAAELAEREAEATAKAEAKASAVAKLAALGLTEGEVAAILAQQMANNHPRDTVRTIR